MIELRDLSVTAGSFSLDRVHCQVPAGAYGVLMGPTGCGKTTVLEIICGLRRAASGQVLVDGRDVTRESPGNRGVGYVPQDGALFPTMTVREHLGFALKIRRQSLALIQERVASLASELSITHLLDRRPHGLSGGERQRVALGRALAANPPVLLLDEPFSALDADMRGEMRKLLKQIHRQHRVTIFHVTHDREEAEDLGEIRFRWQSGHIHREA